MYYSISKILKESIPIMIISAAISTGAGYILNSNSSMILALPGIIVIIPSFINMNGSIVSVLSSRISSALHMGTIKPKFKNTQTLDRNIIATLVITLLSFLSLGVIASIFNLVIGLKSLNIMIFPLTILVAGTLTMSVLSGLSIILSYYSYSRGMDPDNLVIPLLTSVGDFLGILMLFMVFSLFV
jgi:mgtE-like transporter